MFSPARGRSLGARAETEGGLAHYFKGHAKFLFQGSCCRFSLGATFSDRLAKCKELEKQTSTGLAQYFKGHAKLFFISRVMLNFYFKAHAI